MSLLKRAMLALGAFLGLALTCTQPAAAAVVATDKAHEDLVVSFFANLSVKIDGVQYSTRTLGPQTAGMTIVPSSATVTKVRICRKSIPTPNAVPAWFHSRSIYWTYRPAA